MPTATPGQQQRQLQLPVNGYPLACQRYAPFALVGTLWVAYLIAKVLCFRRRHPSVSAGFTNSCP